METGQAGGGPAGGGRERIWPASVHISSKTSRHDSTRNIVLNQHSPQPPLSLHHLDVDDNANMKIMQEFCVGHLMTGEQLSDKAGHGNK